MGAAEKIPEVKQLNKLTGLFFIESVTLNGEQQSVSIGRNVDAIVPAVIKPNGSAVQIGDAQECQGFLLKRKRTDLHTRSEVMDQCFVPKENVRTVVYGE